MLKGFFFNRFDCREIFIWVILISEMDIQILKVDVEHATSPVWKMFVK